MSGVRIGTDKMHKHQAQGGTRYRRYTCQNCGRRFTTWEINASVIDEIWNAEKALNKLLNVATRGRRRTE